MVSIHGERRVLSPGIDIRSQTKKQNKGRNHHQKPNAPAALQRVADRFIWATYTITLSRGEGEQEGKKEKERNSREEKSKIEKRRITKGKREERKQQR